MLGNFRIVTAAQDCEPYCRDESWLTGHCEAVLHPTSREGVGEALRWAAERKMAVTVRGGGTGMSGGAVPSGGVVLVLTHLNDIAVDLVSHIVHAGAGVITGQLNEVLAEHKLWYPVDPSSMDSCTIGGNVATNAGGPRAYRYGVTRNWILQLGGFYADGTPFRTGSLVSKNVAGYDLVSLLTGSQGTLAVITDVWLKVIPEPTGFGALLLFLRDHGGQTSPVRERLLHDALNHDPMWTAVEYFDRRCTVLLADLAGITGTFSDALLIEQTGSPDAVSEELAAFVETFAPQSTTMAGLDPAAHSRIWALRRGMSKAMFRFGSRKYNEDIGLPVGSFSLFLDSVTEWERQSGLVVPVFGHVGDGNLHVNIMHEGADTDRAAALVNQLFGRVLELGGTITGEHGSGLTKRDYLPQQIGLDGVELMHKIKRTFDPEMRLNPDKMPLRNLSSQL